MHRSRHVSEQELDRQKDRLINSLKQEIFELRDGQIDINKLKHQLNDLDDKHSVLLKEKARSERETRQKMEQYYDRLSKYKAQMEKMQEEFKQCTNQNNQLVDENMTLRESLEKKQNELVKLKVKCEQTSELFHQSEDTRLQLKHDLHTVTQEKMQIGGQVDNMAQIMEDHLQQIIEKDDLIKKLEELVGQQQNDCQDLFMKNKKLEDEFEDLQKGYVKIEKRYLQSQETVNELQSALMQREQQVELLNQELRNNNQELESMDKFKIDLQNIIQGFQLIQIKDLEQAHQDSRFENQKLVQKLNISVSKQEDQLKLINEMNETQGMLEDKNLELVRMNQKLLDEISCFNQEDETIRQLLNRKNRANYSSSRR